MQGAKVFGVAVACALALAGCSGPTAACGGRDEDCCEGNECDDGLGCLPRGLGIACQPCGVEGSVCCLGGGCGTTAVCIDNLCEGCGALDEPCCGGEEIRDGGEGMVPRTCLPGGTCMEGTGTQPPFVCLAGPTDGGMSGTDAGQIDAGRTDAGMTGSDAGTDAGNCTPQGQRCGVEFAACCGFLACDFFGGEVRTCQPPAP